MDAPETRRLIRHDSFIAAALKLQALGSVVEVKAGEEILPPRNVVLGGQEEAVRRFHGDVGAMRFPEFRIHYTLRLAGVKHPTVSAPPVPPDPAFWERAAADDAHHADTRIRKERQEIGRKILMNDQRVLMKVDFIFRRRLAHRLIVARRHRGRAANGAVLGGKACGKLQMF